jgi:thioredoxin 1
MFKRLFGGKSAPPPPVDEERGYPNDLTDASFASRIGAVKTLAVVDFWADWCQPCTVMSAYVEFLARDFAGKVEVFALDVDEHQRTSEKYQVMSLPTLIFFRDGEEVHRTVGVSTYEDLKRQTARLLQ